MYKQYKGTEKNMTDRGLTQTYKLYKTNEDNRVLETGLTRGEVEEVQSLWSMIDEDQIEHGEAFLKKMNRQYPHYTEFYETFDSFEHPFMQSLTDMIENLHNKYDFFQITRDAVNVYSDKEQFVNGVGLMSEYCADVYKDQFSWECAEGWNKLVNVICFIIEQEHKLEKYVDSLEGTTTMDPSKR